MLKNLKKLREEKGILSAVYQRGKKYGFICG